MTEPQGPNSIGDGPIDDVYHATMHAIGVGIHHAFNGNVPINQGKTGFILLVFPLGDTQGRCNYLSNASREDVVTMLKEQLARFSGMPGHAGEHDDKCDVNDPIIKGKPCNCKGRTYGQGN